VAFCFGMVDFSDLGSAAWFALPEPLHFGIKFDFASCVAIGLLFAINSIQAIGDFTATTVGGLDRDPTDQELQGGIIAYGASNILTALMGGLPTATYSQNVGIVTTNKVVNRTVFALTGGFLLLAGISPKFAALLTTIPQCVLGGATVTVFSTIAMTGMKLIASQDLTAALERGGIPYDDIPCYATVYESAHAGALRAMAQAGELDLVTFTSASTVKGFVSSVGELDFSGLTGVCIGAQTAAEAAKHGIPTVVAEEATIGAMINCNIKEVQSHGTH